MTTQEYLCRHFARMGARVVVRGPRLRQRTKIAIDVGRDRSGEVFVIGCEEEVAIEVLDVQPRSHHLVLMVRDGSEKHKFLLGRDERHWFAAAVPGDAVRDVRTAIASLRPTEIEGRETIRQGEWFFVPEPGVNDKDAVILRNEPLSRGGGSKPHICAQMMRRGGEAVMVCSRFTELAELIRAALVADLPEAATSCIERLQEAAIHASDITDLMSAIAPLVRVLRYGNARKMPEDALRALVLAMSAEVNAGVRVGSHSLDQDAATARVQAMRAYDEALGIFADASLSENWRRQLGLMVEDDQVAASVAGLSLRRLHDLLVWDLPAVAAAFSRHTSGQELQKAGAFLENFLSGGSEVVLQDQPLLQLIDAWLCELNEQDFVEALPLLRRSFAGFDGVARRRLIETIDKGPMVDSGVKSMPDMEHDGAFAEALPLLYRILGIGGQS